jgi:hypothetical protein
MKRPAPNVLLSALGPIIFFALLVLVIWHWRKAGGMGSREIILVEFTNAVTTIHFKTEMGESFQLIFKTDALSPYTPPGHVHLVNALTKQIADFETDSNYFLPFRSDSILKPESIYEMKVTFPPKTKPAMYVTLEWTQRDSDKGK